MAIDMINLIDIKGRPKGNGICILLNTYIIIITLRRSVHFCPNLISINLKFYFYTKNSVNFIKLPLLNYDGTKFH